MDTKLSQRIRGCNQIEFSKSKKARAGKYHVMSFLDSISKEPETSIENYWNREAETHNKIAKRIFESGLKSITDQIRKVEALNRITW